MAFAPLLLASGGIVLREVRHHLHKDLIGYLLFCAFNYAP